MRKKLGYKFRFREEIENHRCWITVCFVQVAEDDNFLFKKKEEIAKSFVKIINLKDIFARISEWNE